jgi:hypothetical protein
MILDFELTREKFQCLQHLLYMMQPPCNNAAQMTIQSFGPLLVSSFFSFVSSILIIIIVVLFLVLFDSDSLPLTPPRPPQPYAHLSRTTTHCTTSPASNNNGAIAELRLMMNDKKKMAGAIASEDEAWGCPNDDRCHLGPQVVFEGPVR